MLTQAQVLELREDFPILKQKIHKQPLIYFDNAASTPMPNASLDAYTYHSQHHHANIHRGVHTLAQRTTEAYEASRAQIAQWLHVDASEISFHSGTTEGLNALAFGWIKPLLQKGDQVVITALEHHANLVPWQEVCRQTGAQLVYAPLKEDNYQLDYERLDPSRIKVIASQHASNVLPVQQDLLALTTWAHSHDIRVIIDGAQAAPHQSLDLKALGVDAYCFSAHKMHGPTGLGVTYLNSQWAKEAHPFLFGGEMIQVVKDFEASYKNPPFKYEAGTPPIAEAITFGASLDYLKGIDFEQKNAYEHQLTAHLRNELKQIEGITLYEPPHVSPATLVSFNIDGVHPHDAATAYDLEGIAVRAGHHCAQPLMRLLKAPATLRASLAFYNTEEEVEQFIRSTQKVKEFFHHGI